MSTNVYRATFKPGEQLMQEVAARLAQRQQARQERVTELVERALPECEERFGNEGRQMAELTGRFEELRADAPRDLYEEVQASFESGRGVEELAGEVEALEREADRSYQSREIRGLGMAEIARDSGGTLESPQLEPGDELRSTFHFRDGGQMAVAMPAGSLGDGVSWQIAWYGRTSDTRDCDSQEQSVRQVVESKDNLSMSDERSHASEVGDDPGEAREAAGEAG